MQQKDYSKAFVQEKALHKRNLSSLKGIIELGQITFEDTYYEDSKNCFNYVLENTDNLEEKLIAKLYLLQISIETKAEISNVEMQFQQLFKDIFMTKKLFKLDFILKDPFFCWVL